MSKSPITNVRKRIRLSPAVRSQQILDAALVEFSQHGFAATRIVDIARRIGLSKSGVYAHFASKEEVFEALLAKTLAPPAPVPAPEPAIVDPAMIRRRTEDFVDRLYARLADPAVTATLRLLIAESARVPHLIRNWRRDIVAPYLRQQRQRLREAVECGCLPRSALSEDFVLAHAPALLVAVRMMIFQEGIDEDELEALKRSHKRMLLEWLRVEDMPTVARHTCDPVA